LKKLNRHHKQIKKAEPIRTEATKQISKTADFSIPRSWGGSGGIWIYANLGAVEDFYATGDREKWHTA